MTRQEFLTLLKSSQFVKSEYIYQLKELIELYPYFTPARLLYLKALKQSDNMHYEKSLTQTALYSSDRVWLYHFINPTKVEPLKEKRGRQEIKSGDYFDMLNVVEKEGEDVNQSLKQLAERLKKARSVITDRDEKNQRKEHIEPKRIPIMSTSFEVNDADYSVEKYTEKVKELIHSQKYHEALEILRKLNLNYPKKSIYFADQIRFLEKIIENIKN